MLTPHDSASAFLAGEVALETASEELRRRIYSGEAARAEEYLDAHSELALDAEQALDLIYVEYAARRAVGAAPSREEYVSRFPLWREQLERQFQLADLFEEPAANVSRDRLSHVASRRFRATELLARGGIGQVLRAMDAELHREVAVKELHADLAADPAVRERFLREAEITGQLEHPGIVPVYGLGHDADGRPFYAMRLVRGQNFQEAAAEFHGAPTVLGHWSA